MPSNELNFDTTIPATRVGKLYNYIQIPEFSYTGIMWKDVSEAIIQFNYSLTNNFILRKIPAKPTGVNFNICIRYRVGETVYRYKLWDNLEEVMPNIEKYTGQLIKKNCVVEIWTLANQETISLASPLNLETSIRTLPASLIDLSDVENVESSLVSDLGLQTLVPALPTTGLYGRYSQDDVVVSGFNSVDQWNDSSGNNRHLVSAGTSKPSNNPGYVEFAGDDYLAYNVGQPFSMLGMYLVSKQSLNPPLAYILKNSATNFETLVDFPDQRFKIVKSDGSDFVYLQPTLNQLQVFWLRYDEATNKNYGGIDNLFASSEEGTFVGDDQATMAYLSLGDLDAVAAADMKVYELLVYNSPITEAQHIQILQYLANKFNPEPVFVLSNSWDTTGDVAWLDNA